MLTPHNDVGCSRIGKHYQAIIPPFMTNKDDEKSHKENVVAENVVENELMEIQWKPISNHFKQKSTKYVEENNLKQFEKEMSTDESFTIQGLPTLSELEIVAYLNKARNIHGLRCGDIVKVMDQGIKLTGFAYPKTNETSSSSINSKDELSVQSLSSNRNDDEISLIDTLSSTSSKLTTTGNKILKSKSSGYMWGIYVEDYSIDKSSSPDTMEDVKEDVKEGGITSSPRIEFSSENDDIDNDNVETGSVLMPKEQCFTSTPLIKENSFNNIMNSSPPPFKQQVVEVESGLNNNMGNQSKDDDEEEIFDEMKCEVMVLSRGIISKPKKQCVGISHILGRFDQVKALKCLYGERERHPPPPLCFLFFLFFYQKLFIYLLLLFFDK